MTYQKVLILDFGGQYEQLIARRVRECGVYSEVKPFTMSIGEIKEFNPVGIIFTGGPQSVYRENSPHPDEGIFRLGIPILGICYGCQLVAYHSGGNVVPAGGGQSAEYGGTLTFFDTDCAIFRGIKKSSITWMSHADCTAVIPEGFLQVARSEKCPNAAIADEKRKFYGVQFHPEVNHTECGKEIIKNFLYGVCGAAGDWKMESYAKTCVKQIKEKTGGGKVLLALSGGVDSSVCAALFAEAIGKRLTCVFVNHGLLRKNESDEVERVFGKRDINFIRIDAEKKFLSALKGVTDPERKRKIIGELFIRVFEEAGRKIGRADYLAQGTIYPDVIESGKGPAQTIKSHHNVGGLPEVLEFKEIIEPLKMLFKDEVRALGREIGLPEYLISRQPFPGPGLGIRIIGEITEEKLKILREADFIFREEISKAGLRENPDQYFAALTDMRSVGVMGDGRSYDYAVALRAVRTDDFMTADWAKIPYDVLGRISCRIVNEVGGVNRVFYDITSKPPATVEYE